jgi:flagellar biogenesis protein FliO
MNADLSARLAALWTTRRNGSAAQSPVQSPASWFAWMRAALRFPVRMKRSDARSRIELLDRLSLGGKRALLLVAIDGCRLLVGVGEDGAPAISTLDKVARIPGTGTRSSAARPIRRRRSQRARSAR